jgi:Ca2+-binding RTX toxin-like protein
LTAPLDRLESRVLFTWSGFKDSGILTVEANPGDDVIVVKLVTGAVQITVNAEAPLVYDLQPRPSRHPRYVQWVKIEGLAGNDTIRLDGAVNNSFGLILQGGDGDDTLEGGCDRFVALGGAGNDTIRATGSGQNELSGETGDDRIIATSGHCVVAAGAGRDWVQTDGGNDAIWGGPGSDTVDAGAGNDTVLGGRGDDSIAGGDGEDWLFGQRDDDSIAGGAGDDHLFGQDGVDLLTGGTGADTIFTGTGVGGSADGSDPADRVRGREYRRLGRLLDELLPGAGRPM